MASFFHNIAFEKIVVTQVQSSGFTVQEKAWNTDDADDTDLHGF